MTEDPATRSAVGEELEQSPSSVHDDIVKRLLDYQRQLRDEKGDVATPDRPSVTDDTMLDAPSASTVVGVDTEAGTDALVEEHVVEVPAVETRAAEPRTVE